MEPTSPLKGFRSEMVIGPAFPPAKLIVVTPDAKEEEAEAEAEAEGDE